MTAVDATGLHAIEDLAARLRASGRALILCGAREQPSVIMRAAGLPAHLGEASVCPDIRAALERAERIRGTRPPVAVGV